LAKRNFLKLPQWLQSGVFYRAKIKTGSGDDWENAPCVPVHPYDANLVSSENQYGLHNLFIDLDGEHWYTESSTAGHGHLAIRSNLRIDQLQEIVDVLVKHGILEQGIKRQADERGCLTLRMPGMKKDVKEDNMSFDELAEIGKKPKPVDQKDDSLYHRGGPVTPAGAIAKFFDNLI
jgi:hypothetical protein